MGFGHIIIGRMKSVLQSVSYSLSNYQLTAYCDAVWNNRKNAQKCCPQSPEKKETGMGYCG
jgi:hypothetical protein